MIYTGFKKREAELFLKLSVDATGTACKIGIEPVVDIWLLDYKLERDSEATKPRAVYEVGIEESSSCSKRVVVDWKDAKMDAAEALRQR